MFDLKTGKMVRFLPDGEQIRTINALCVWWPYKGGKTLSDCEARSKDLNI